MQNQQLLLLQILKIPVIVIYLAVKILSVATYVPNYLYLWIVDFVLFNEYLSASLFMYVLTWPLKILLFASAVGVFLGEFYMIFVLLELSSHSLTIQISGMVLTLAGLVILMRKGYLSIIQNFNISKLKSPMEHAEIGVQFLVDLFGITLFLVNSLMIVNLKQSWNYLYSSQQKYTFIVHIFGLIKKSIIFYIQFFYIKIFFRMFPWRFVRELDTFKKEKEEKNVLNCLVLLTLIYLATLLDILSIILLGLPNIIHMKRKIYYTQLRNTHEKWKITTKHFGFVCLHSSQLVIQLICFLFCWKNGKKCLKQLLQYQSTDKLFGVQFKQLIIETIIKIPYLISSLIILCSIYKEKRKNILLQKLKQKQQQPKESQKQERRRSYQEMIITFKCLRQLSGDVFFYGFIILATLLKPWNYWWVRYLLNEEYELNRTLIITYTFKNIGELFVFPLAVIPSLAILLYDYQKPINLMKLSKDIIEKVYIEEMNKAKSGIKFDINRFVIQTQKSQIFEYFILTLNALRKDICHLPLFYITNLTFLNIYKPDIKPEITYNLLYSIHSNYYQLSLKSSPRIKLYQQMMTNMKAAGQIKSYREERRFWKFAYRCDKIMLFQRIFKALLPGRTIIKINNNIQKGTDLSQLSNQYWYQYDLAKRYALVFLLKTVQLIVSLIGVLILFPLTLWRIPTFIKLYLIHKSRQYFFNILGKVYKQLFYDVITLPLKFICIVSSPKQYFQFVRVTSFQYGSIELFQTYQHAKRKYLLNDIFGINFIKLTIHLQVLFILIFWIRIKNLKNNLRQFQKLTLSKLYTTILLASKQVPSMEVIVTDQLVAGHHEQLRRVSLLVFQLFLQALHDLPYLLLILIIFITMPWRINYIIQTIKDMRDDSKERKAFFKLIRNIFKDYACIFMNIFLLLSIFKTKKSLLLIRRNYRLNFFIGFLDFAYYNELKNQMISLFKIYRSLLFFIIACLFGWTRITTMLNELKELKKKLKQEQESSLANKKLYQDTLKEGKQLKTLNKMGYYNYINVCSFLTVPELIKLRQVDKFNYTMTQREEIWFMKWELIYSKKNEDVSQDYELRCKSAFLKEIALVGKQVVTYDDVILRYFKRNVFEEDIHLREFLQQKLSPQHFDKWFKNYRYQVHEGYGPENQLPQAENEDQQFLRLTNQVRRPKVLLSENDAWMHMFYVRMVQFLVQKMHTYFREDTMRRKKQSILILSIIFAIISYVTVLWTFRNNIFTLDSLIGIKLIFAYYFHTFISFVFLRAKILYQNWISLIPFDLKYDFIRYKDYIITQVYLKVVFPCKKALKYCYRVFVQFIKKCYEAISRIAKTVDNKVKDVIILIYLKIADTAEKTANFTVKYSKIFYEKVVKPLYISIADKLRTVKDMFVKLMKAILKSVKSLLQFLGTMIKSFYLGIRAIFSNINRLYYVILESSMKFLLKFGLIGNLIFTIFGLVVMTLPTIVWWMFYSEKWYLVVSSIHSMVLIVIGYKHLNKIRANNK